jgi:hypothetical protein
MSAEKLTDWAKVRSDAGLDVRVATESATPHVGSLLVFHVQITNLTGQDIAGVYVDLGGDWTRVIVGTIKPSGTLHHDAASRYIVSPLGIPPGETGLLDVTTLPQQTGPAQLVFWVRALTADELSQDL